MKEDMNSDPQRTMKYDSIPISTDRILPDFAKSLEDITKKIVEMGGSPESASVEIEKYFLEWDQNEYSRLIVSYKRPETDLELTQRVESERSYTEQAEVRDRAEYERLSKKFGKQRP